MNNMDYAGDRLTHLIPEIESDLENIYSEEDAKVKIINRIFTECLGWSYTNFHCENSHSNGFSDYILKVADETKLLIEAKRLGKLEIQTADVQKCKTFKISGSALKPSINGIKQAFQYSSEQGIPISVVTDGVIWIVFKTWVNGSSYLNKEAYVFPSLEAIKNDFSIFYDLLSYEQFSKKAYNILFDRIHNSRQNLSIPLNSAYNQEEIQILRKSNLAYDLEKIFNNFFTQLTGNDDSEIMLECFVESNESRIADYSLEKITSTILNNFPKENSNLENELSTLIYDNVQSSSTTDTDMSVFIVGPTGSGKTTYIERFFSKVLPNNTRENCITLNINSLNASGDITTALTWITEEIIKSLESNLFSEGFPEYKDLQGMYFGQYRRFSAGVYKKIYENDKVEFNKIFTSFLEKETRENREQYLKNLLHYTINNRKKLPIIIIDNTDEFSIEFKTQIFQLCNAYRREAKHCMLMFPMTDKSAWSFSKTDIFTIHQSKSFFLPTPSPKEVFRKRIDFLKKKLINSETHEKEKKQYLSNKGIKIELNDLASFAKVLEDIFIENNFTARTLGEITNYNIRSIMNLSKRIITSPVMKIDDLIKSYVTSEPISYTKFIDALIRGDYEAYRVNSGEDFGVVCTFNVSSKKIHSPLLTLRVLALLRATSQHGRNIEERHLTILSMFGYFDSIGIDSIDVEACLSELVAFRLIELYDPSENVLNDNQKVAITYKGQAHYNLSTRNSVYFYQMALTTGIANQEIADKIKSIKKSHSNFGEITSNIRRIFSEFLIEEDKKYVHDTFNEKDIYSCQKELLLDIINYQKKNISENTLPDNLLKILNLPIKGTIERFDPEEGYGYIILQDINYEILFRTSELSINNAGDIYSSDIVHCTITQADKGVKLETIDGLVEAENSFEEYECTIKKYFPNKGFGFVTLSNIARDVFFHKTSMPIELHEDLEEGKSFKTELRLLDVDKYQVRRFIEVIE